MTTVANQEVGPDSISSMSKPPKKGGSSHAGFLGSGQPAGKQSFVSAGNVTTHLGKGANTLPMAETVTKNAGSK